MKKILLILFAYCCCQNVKSQAYNAGTTLGNYTDINPDSLMHYVYFPYTHQVVDLTILGNSADLEFIADGSSSPGGSSAYINVKSLNPDVYISFGRLDSVYDSTSSSWLITKVARVLNAGDPINAPGAVWDNNSVLYISDHSASFGWAKDVNDWIGTDRYIGLKYDDGNSIAYGWMRVQCFDEDSCYIKDFSFTPMLMGVNEIETSRVLVYPNPCSSYFKINYDPLLPAEEISVYDVTGSCILKKRSTHSLTEEIDLTSQAAGIYLLEVTSSAGMIHRKIIKE